MSQIGRKPVPILALPNDVHPADEILVDVAMVDGKAEPRNPFLIDDYTQAATVTAARVQGAEVQHFGPDDPGAHQGAIMRHMPVVMVDKTVAVRRHPIYGAGKFFRVPEVVGIEKGDEPATRGFQRHIPRYCGTFPPGCAKPTETRIFSRHSLNRG
jgi:hypothetical protein